MPKKYSRQQARQAFWAKIARQPGADACWLWTGARHPRGYGYLNVAGRKRASRVAYEYTKGPIPPGMEVRHTCDNPPCCRPKHLILGTHRQNMEDRDARHPGFQARGEANGKSKLTIEAVRDIRRRFKRYVVTDPMLATEYGVSAALIYAVRTRKIWRHIE